MGFLIVWDDVLSIVLFVLLGLTVYIEADVVNASNDPDQIENRYEEVPTLEVFPSFNDLSPVTEEPDEPAEETTEKEQEFETEQFSRRMTFLELVSGACGFTPIGSKPKIVKGKPESICFPRNLTENSTAEVQLVNSTTLLAILGNKNETLGPCSVVLFFAPWCMFCAKIAPYYNALARAFPQMNVLAINSVHFSSLNTRYGTIAVPNILVFYNNSKGVARFNHTERSFETFVDFVQNVTGFTPDPSVHVTPEDYEGPLRSTWTKNDDWLLWLSWIFVIMFVTVMFAKSNIGQRVINAVMNFGVEHEHHLD